MIDFNRVVGEIRVFLQSADRTDQPQAAALAGELAAACSEANDRLNRCAFFLRQGLRTEAIHLASTEPDLLDMVRVLDFPERAQWDELAIAYNWTRTPALAIDAAQALNEAYTQEDPLADLLRTHRRLALARAPLAHRIETMRKIARVDPENPIWVEDLRLFEQARHDQLKAEIPVALANQNAAALEAILHEIEAADWSAPPRDPLVAQARSAVSQLRQKDSRKALNDLLGALHKANASNDPILGRKLRARWNSLIEGAELSPADPLRAQAQSVLDWLAREDDRAEKEAAYQEALADLDAALRDGAKQEDLAAREEAVLGFGQGMPLDYQAQIRERYRALQRAARLRNRLIAAGVGAATLALIGIVLWSNHQKARAQEITLTVASVEKHLDAEELDEARGDLEHLERLYPGASKAKELVTALNRLDAKERQEKDRQDRFAKALAEARNAPLPDTDDDPALETVRKLARLESEKIQVKDLATRRKTMREDQRAQVDRILRPRLDDFIKRVVDAETRFKQEPGGKETEALLSSLSIEAEKLKDEVKDASKEIRGEVTLWLGRFDAIRSARASAREQDEKVEGMIKAAGSIERAEDVKGFVDLCMQFAKEHPDTPRAQAIRKLFEEQVLWQSVVAWSAMVQSWSSLAPGETKERLRQIAEYRVNNPKYPPPQVFESCKRYFEAQARLATAGDEDPPSQLRRIFSNPLVEDVWRVRDLNGKTYYSLKKPTDQANGHLVMSLVSTDPQEKPRAVFVPTAIFATMDSAPQSKLARRVKDALAGATATAARWDAAMVGILRDIQSQPELDPLLRVILLKGTIQAASLGSAPLEEALKTHARAIDQARLNLDVAWVDPDDLAADPERRRARKTLDRFPSLAPCVKMAEEVRQRFQTELSRTYWPVGLLWKDPDGSWRCHSSEPIPTGTELFVIVPDGSWKKIGKATGPEGEFAAEPGAPEPVEGRLIFHARRSG
jgi:hypothetical protein